MIRTLLLSLSGAAAATVLAFGVAQAAPTTGTLDSVIGANQSQAEQVHYRYHRYHRCHRHCWRHHGHWHCRRVCHW